MKEFTFRGRVTLSGVVFTIQAEDEAEAREKAKKGQYHDYDTSGALTVDWAMDPKTCQPG